MPYTHEQIGPILVRPVNAKTRDRLGLVLVQHDRHRGHDETHVTVMLPTDHRAGRERCLRMLAAGIDIDDIRCVVIPSDFVGQPEGTDGLPLHPASHALWWTASDESRRAHHENGLLDIAGYAASILALRNRTGKRLENPQDHGRA